MGIFCLITFFEYQTQKNKMILASFNQDFLVITIWFACLCLNTWISEMLSKHISLSAITYHGLRAGKRFPANLYLQRDWQTFLWMKSINIFFQWGVEHKKHNPIEPNVGELQKCLRGAQKKHPLFKMIKKYSTVL